MERIGILAKLEKIFTEIFDEEVELTEATTPFDLPEWGSLAHVRICAAVQQSFNVQLKPSKINRIENVGDLVNLIADEDGFPLSRE
jgi:acyl carrier protein